MRWGAATAELVLSRGHKRHPYIVGATTESRVVTDHEVVKRLPEDFATFHHDVEMIRDTHHHQTLPLRHTLLDHEHDQTDHVAQFSRDQRL